MIIGDLIDLYHRLDSENKICPFGWREQSVRFALSIVDDGSIVGIDPLGDTTQKNFHRVVTIPHGRDRSSGILANFLCDNAKYLLAEAGDSVSARAAQRAQDCFEASRALHHQILDGVDDSTASAVLAFFDRGPQRALAESYFSNDSRLWSLFLTSNLVFEYHGTIVSDVPAVRDAWNEYLRHTASSHAGTKKRQASIVSGNEVVPAEIHPKIRGVMGAQAQAALCSSNLGAFDSYGKEKCLNAPMSEKEAFEYTTALNYLLSHQDYHTHIGDLTIVFWSDSAEEQYNDPLSELLMGFGQSSGEKRGLTQRELSEAVNSIAQGRRYDYGGFELDPDEPFHILAIEPSAARLAVSFYLTNSFGGFVRRIRQHYSDMSVDYCAKGGGAKQVKMGLWGVLSECDPQKSSAENRGRSKWKAPSLLINQMFRAILFGDRYPATLLVQTLLRLHSGNQVTPRKAAIVRGYYLRAKNPRVPKEVLAMSLNDETNARAYVLGRMLAVYQQIQEKAQPGIVTTIADRYFSSASSTPAAIFPVIGRMCQIYQRKLTDPEKIYFNRKIENLASRIGTSYPSRLTVPEQGAFQLGYYFENEERYKKHQKATN